MATGSAGGQLDVKVLGRLFDRILILACFIGASIPYWPFKVDDAYTSYVYARNLAAGMGLTYNGMAVEGYSNFLWTVLISPFLLLRVDPLWVARGLSLASVFVLLLLLYELLRELQPGASKGIALLAVLSVGLSSPILAWTFGGLETVVFALLVLLFVWTEGRRTKSSRWLSPLLTLLAALTRPEGLMLFPIWLLYRLFRRDRPRQEILLPSLVFLLPYGLFLVWRLSYYGYPLPNPAYLKLDPPSFESVRLAGQWLLDYLRLRPAFALLLAVGLIALVRERRRLPSIYLLAGAVTLAFLAFVLYCGRDWMPHHRFLAPVVPLLALPVARALTWPGAGWSRRLMVVLAGAGIAMEVGLSVTLYRPVSLEFGRFTDGLVRAGQWIRANTSPGVAVAVIDAGAIAFHGERPTIDMPGLNNASIAHAPDHVDLDYVFAQEPRVIQLHSAFTEAGELVPQMNRDLNQLILEDERFKACYWPDVGRPEDPYYPYMFVRVCN